MVFLFWGTLLHAQTPQILKDINGLVTNNSQTAAGYNFIGYNGLVYFSAEDGFNGFELWKTNGTEVGTVLVKDIASGSLSSSPGTFVVMNSILFFVATNSASGTELWKTDGTAAGTVIVKDINSGSGSSSPENLLVINGILYFTATTTANGRELWKSDGTSAGTVLINDIIPGPTNSTPQNLVNYRDTLYFTASFTGINRELWKSDGTTAGTVLVKDINPGVGTSFPDALTVSGNFLFFTANDGSTGTELWRTDGSESGTIMLKDIRPGTSSSFPSELKAVNNLLVFRANDGSSGEELWGSDGTSTGTFLLKDINPGTLNGYPNFLTVVGNTVFFGATDPVNADELWKTDGTSAGTVLVKDLSPGLGGSNPDKLININGILFFTAYTNSNGVELWKSDGTTAGTIIVKDINPGLSSGSPTRLTNVNGILYFTATQGTEVLLFKSDGTQPGTVALNTTAVSNGSYNSFYGFENKLYFMYNGYKPGIPVTATGIEPWVSDGTNAGTTLIKDINATTNAANPGPYGKAGNTIFFAANDGESGIELWKTDGTAAGTVLLKDINTGTGSSTPANFTNVNGIMFFTATVSASGTELWKTDGTNAGTVMVKDIRAGTAGSAPASLTASGNLLYLIANDGSTGAELWKSDGTSGGTILVADIVAGTGTPSLTLLKDVNGTLFFTASVAASGRELWKSDGTAAGTVMVKDIIAGAGSPGITNLVAYNGKVFFNANDGINGNEPWMSDGTASGTTLLKDIATSGTFPDSNPGNFAVAENKIYFTAFTASTQYEPWISDGTPAGTYMITEIVPGSAGSVPNYFTGMDGFVYFAANGPGSGRELWRTDGTAAGTQLVIDINIGSGHATPELLTAVNSTLFFRAAMPGGGVEIYKTDGTAAGTVGYDIFPGTTTSNPDYLTSFNNKLIFSATHQSLGREMWKIDVIPASNFTIVGDTTPCIGSTGVYSATNVVVNDVTYNWSLPLGGGTIINADTTFTVTWTTGGARSVQLILSNAVGNSAPKTLTLTVSGIPPAVAPVIYNFARTLSTNSLPPGAICQWFKNDTAIAGATNTFYYAAAAGNYTAKFKNDCGTGPASNIISFPADAITQTISFPHVANVSMSPTARAVLQATASSALPVYYQKISGPGNISNDTLYITGAGTIIVKAQQPGDNVYRPAIDKFDTITVIKGNQVITFESIPPQILNTTNYILQGSSSMGLTISYSIVAGSALAVTYGNQLIKFGAGLVTVRASQAGDNNYNPATPVDRTFCIGVRTLTPITGDINPCINTYRYNTQKIPGANFVWTLSGGGILTTNNNDTAWVQWQTPGSHTLSVKANSPCDAVYTSTQVLQITTSNNLPVAVTNMLPVNNAVDQQLPLALSWIPGGNTVNYDLYVWDSAVAQPGTPYVSNLNTFLYVLPNNSFAYNKTYKWRVVSKNPCSQTAGPVQQFRLIPLPDLVVSDVQAPATATSGQTVTISWKVTNTGPGRTPPGAHWYDGVYFALDTLPYVNFQGSPNWDPNSWSSLTANGRPLLLGTKIRPTSLESGQFYTNSLDFTLPLQYSFPVYIYVITDNYHPNYKILQVSVANDTARKQSPMIINLLPTPDLRVDSVFAPATTFSGSAVNLTYKVKNYGVVTPAGKIWIDSVFISQSPLFDRSTAVPIDLPKINGSYYPGATKATTFNNTQLLPDSFYTKNLQVVIPNYIFGTWFIYVKANAHVDANNPSLLYEGALSNNNINRGQLQMYLTPTPKLTVSNLTVPVTAASTTQPVGVNWKIKNEGFRDNIEKNRGHFITMSTCIVPCGPGSPPNSVCTSPSVVRDSIVFGSSYWIDRVYLSTDSSGLNLANAILVKETNHGVLNSGLYTDPVPSYVNCPALVTGNVNVNNVIQPGSEFPKAEGFIIPANLQPGSYYVYVYANPTKTVFEYPGTAQIKRSTLPIAVQRPDATVPAISVPSNSNGGQAITINYSVLNNGPGAVFNHQRKDRFYISNFSNFDGSAQLIGTQTFTEDLPVGNAVPHTFTYNMPPATTGAKYFYVETNYDSLFRETNSANNRSISAATSVTAAIPSDLIVASVIPADSVFTIFSSKLKYTVVNNGSGTTAGTWTDSLFISCSPSFNPATSYYIGKLSQSRTIPSAGNYTDSININLKYGYEINSCFPELMHSTAYFYVKVNADTGTYEGTNINNNIGGSGSKVLVNPLVDHIVTNVSAPDTTTVGSAYPVSWRVKNIGYNPNNNYYYSWADAIYFSTDSLASANDIVAGQYLKYIRLNRNQDSADSKSPYTPNMPAGDYYVYVHNNRNDGIPAEKILTNNVNFIRNGAGAAKKIHVIQPALADLRDTIISAPASVASGQPITIVYKINNAGTGTTFPGSAWQNEIKLSDDFFANPNDGDRLLATRYRTGALLPGQFYYDTATVTIPLNTLPGNYVLIGEANSNKTIVESNSNNNLGFSLIEVYKPPVTDLIVGNITKPDTVMLGYTMDTAKWVVTNLSGEQARGYTKDGIYLSAGNLFDSTAVLIGIKDKNILMQPLQKDTLSMAPLVTGVVEGNYNVFVKTDLLNNILESNKNNNVGMTATPVYVKVKELNLNIPESNTLHKINRYYKLKIPASLIGATILVTLKSNDSLSMRNEMFIAGRRIPTPANYDYSFEIPNYGNQQIVITTVTDSVYYIMYRCVSPNPLVQNVTLKAVQLPFAILNVHTNSGGNIGNVTIRIKGSLFRDSMIAKLSNAGTTIYASAVYFTNSTQVFATFPLQGKPLGIYNVTLIKPDSSTAVLANSFSIVPANNGGLITGGGVNTGAGNGNAPGCDPGAASGLNSQLVVDLVVPQRALVNRPIIIQVNYSNPTNFDIPAQSRILYSEAGMKMAFTIAGVPSGTTSLYLELTEPGGPPGIIRAGGSGTITVHSKAPANPPAAGFVLFKLK